MPTIEEVLATNGKLVYRIKGTSMRPMLKQERDVVVIERPDGLLRRYDIPLYKSGENYVLHRVIRVRDGSYLIRGDNTEVDEQVPFDAVIGVLTAVSRNGKNLPADRPAFRIYAFFRVLFHPLRRMARQIQRRIRTVFC